MCCSLQQDFFALDKLDQRHSIQMMASSLRPYHPSFTFKGNQQPSNMIASRIYLSCSLLLEFLLFNGTVPILALSQRNCHPINLHHLISNTAISPLASTINSNYMSDVITHTGGKSMPGFVLLCYHVIDHLQLNLTQYVPPVNLGRCISGLTNPIQVILPRMH
jgi:hypothetical protein